jgi:hypothetical protein
MKRIISLIIVLSLLVVSLTGCYGSFQLTRNLWKWNGTIGEKWTNELVFLVLNIVPVYGVATLIDGIVINSIQFWTGKNPVTADKGGRTIKVVSAKDQQAVLAFYGDGRLKMDLFTLNQPVQTLTIERDSTGNAVAKDRSGAVLMTAKTLDNGRLVLLDKENREIASK